MKTIYKYPLIATDLQYIDMPNGAVILTVQMQGGAMCLWAQVDLDKAEVVRVIAVYGTGNLMPAEAGQYVGSVQMPPFVWHVYDKGETI